MGFSKKMRKQLKRIHCHVQDNLVLHTDENGKIGRVAPEQYSKFLNLGAGRGLDRAGGKRAIRSAH
jgi:hypothetical protein